MAMTLISPASEAQGDLSGQPRLLGRRAVNAAIVAAPFWARRTFAGAAGLPIGRDLSPERAAGHLLNRICFGPAPGEIDRVLKLGPEAYVAEQTAPDRIEEPADFRKRLAAYLEAGLTAQQILRRYSGDADAMDDPAAQAGFKGEKQSFSIDLVQARLCRAVESPRQLQEVLTNFWFNHFNVGRGKPWVTLLFGNYEDTAIRPHVLGRFRDMLGATAHHPAMLLYLDNDKSRAEVSKVRAASLGVDVAPPGINENYARELMELHTLGVNGGYSQADVIALARILSGWRVHRRNGGDAAKLGDFLFDDRVHDPGEKMFLGHRIAPAGETEGERALDILARHPSTARHIAFQLAQYFIADSPDGGVVDRLARRFMETDGDLRAVTRAIFESPEFWSPASVGQKFKTPYDYVVSTLRAVGPEGHDYRRAHGALRAMGMPVYGCPTPDGYKNTETAWLSAEALEVRLSYAAEASKRIRDAESLGRLERTLRGAIGPDAARIASTESPPNAAAVLLGSPGFMRR